ncbi:MULTISPECIES: low temperature requirement protein A [Glycomyces]|uniref:Low temperature requirement protein A n=2 Tax=Glycomyces TaxID=58113 RepID=A0A9X3SWJ9_9ACTN|nr:low temperature requirement protein A [Glycomyces lechevalierae]MDA1384166.1 low temperature requirement protein A [Glycomyces lechevalierae]MDR7339404.1 low temperature requirement protein LtrA [Glycomyces lechevalierae]
MSGSIALGLATIAVLLKLYFDARAAHAAGEGAIAGESRVVPLSSFAYTLMVTGVVVVAAGVVLVLIEPWETASATTIAAVLGGPAIFLVGDVALRRAVTGRIAASRIVALVCLAVLALIGFALPALVLAALAFALLLLLLLAASGWFRLPSLSVDD